MTITNNCFAAVLCFLMTTFACLPTNGQNTLVKNLKENDLSKYSYLSRSLKQVDAIHFKGNTLFSSFFIEWYSDYYLVTARHCVFSLTKEQDKPCPLILIYTHTNNGIDSFPIVVKEILHIDTIDIALVKLFNIDTGRINVLHLQSQERFFNDYKKGTKVKMIGFPASTVINSSVFPSQTQGELVTDYLTNSKANPILLANFLSTEGVSGSPLYGINVINGKKIVDLIGVDSGSAMDKQFIKRELFINSSLIYKLLLESYIKGNAR